MRVINRLSQLLLSAIRLGRFALRGKHPKRLDIVVAYLRFRVRMMIARGAIHTAALLGRTVHFGDVHTFVFLLDELFIEETYARDGTSAPQTIVDCGSNIGMSILLFKSLWPDAKVTGVEASPDTFKLLQENVTGLPGVITFNKVVSDNYGAHTFYSSSNSLLSSTSAQRGGGDAYQVEAVPLSLLVKEPIDLLKIDIEGSEYEALAELELSGRMSMVREMLIECHHNLPGEPPKLSALLARLERCGFAYELAAKLPSGAGEFQDILVRARRTVDVSARAGDSTARTLMTATGEKELCTTAD